MYFKVNKKNYAFINILHSNNFFKFIMELKDMKLYKFKQF